MIFDVAPQDPMTLVVVSVVLMYDVGCRDVDTVAAGGAHEPGTCYPNRVSNDPADTLRAE